MKNKIKTLMIFGTRPEAIKMAPLIKEFDRRKNVFENYICLTAQHRNMLDEALGVFGIKADYDLNIMEEKQTLTKITVETLLRLDNLFNAQEEEEQKKSLLIRRKPIGKPDLILVHGDTTSALAASLAAYYKKIPVGHIEAGLRTLDKYQPYPEEINRRLVDDIADLHFAPTETSKKALLKENIPPEGIFVTGNTVIDALKGIAYNDKKPLTLPPQLSRFIFQTGKDGAKLVLMTCHRRENFGTPIKDIFRAVKYSADENPRIRGKIKIIYPVHPNPNVREPAKSILGKSRNIRLTDPLDYFTLVKIMSMADFILTDSGGLQEEGPALGKPVLVMRNVSERPEAIKAGVAKLVGNTYEEVSKNIERLTTDKKLYLRMSRGGSPYGDGKASVRIADAIEFYFKFRKNPPEDFEASPLDTDRHSA